MGFFDWLKKRDREVDPSTVDDVLLKAILSGEPIKREDALTLPAVSGAVDFICGTIASMPVKLYKYKDGKVEEQTKDPRVKMLNTDTGDTLDAFQMKKALVELDFDPHGVQLIESTERESATILMTMRGYIDETMKIPHIGWNGLHFKKEHFLFKYIKEGDHAYFVHSYHATDCDKDVLATTEYDKQLTAAIGKDNVLGCQFHPEKSGDVGLNILRAFVEEKD